MVEKTGAATFTEARIFPQRGTWVAPLEDMNAPTMHDNDPGLEGPDYVTLVIEWNEDADTGTFASVKEPVRTSSNGRTLATLLGALAAIAFATWGIRHLRTS
jgi:hypothetical protein